MSLIDLLFKRTVYTVVSSWNGEVPCIEGTFKDRHKAKECFAKLLDDKVGKHFRSDSARRNYSDCVTDMEYCDKETHDYLKVFKQEF